MSRVSLTLPDSVSSTRFNLTKRIVLRGRGHSIWAITRHSSPIKNSDLGPYPLILTVVGQVLVQLGIATPELIHIITERKLSFFGHVVRANGLTAHLITGQSNGKRPRGRPRATWISNLAEKLGSSAAKCVRAARQRRISYPRDGRRSSEWVSETIYCMTFFQDTKGDNNRISYLETIYGYNNSVMLPESSRMLTLFG